MDLLRRGVMDPTRISNREAIALRYQFLVEWPKRVLEVSVEGPLAPETDPWKYYSGQDFYGACMKALTNEAESFCITSIAEATWFRSFVPAEPRRITSLKNQNNPFRAGNSLKPLSTLLYDVDATRQGEQPESFRRSDRIRLGFKIVECGLFLSGTSWLAGLKSQYIRRSRDGEDNRRFLLDTQVSKTEVNDNDFRKFAEHAFAIGVLLTEIGTGRVVHDIPKRTKNGQGFSLYATRSNPPSDPEIFSGAQIENLLVVAMGDEYAKPVKVCLESKQSWKEAVRHTVDRRLEVYQSVLADYYSEVYIPLKTLQDRIEWETGRDEAE